jgi:hypothetical protein
MKKRKISRNNAKLKKKDSRNINKITLGTCFKKGG